MRHEAILENGLVPPGVPYCTACQSKQLVPPRYKKLFSEGSCYLPDRTALELLGKQCHFHPSAVCISTNIFGTFYESVSQTTLDLSFLTDFIKDLESLTIGEANNSNRYGNDAFPLPHCPKAWQPAEVASEVLKQIISTANPKLTALSIKRSREVDNFTPSMAPILISSYGGLKELYILEDGDVTVDIPKLIAITEFQHSLHTISITHI